ncbi:MAG TPA: universal stress protein [Rhodospirillales bacterium]|nr:universal stress protein [Rhodospirillales bacterium]
MHRFARILVALDRVDPADPALVRSAALARDSGAALTIALSLEEFGRDWPLDDLRRIIVDGVTGKLEQIADPIREQGTAVDVRLLFGRPFLEIILQVLRGGHDIVIKTAGGGRRIGTALFGSTDMHLFRKCPCPVWLIRTPDARRPGGVLAAVAPDANDASQQRLAAQIVDLAMAMALRESLPLHVVHAWQPPFDVALQSAPWLQIPEVRSHQFAEQVREHHELSFTQLLDALPACAIDVRHHLVNGRATEVVPQIAAEEQVDVIVMATLSRGGVPGLLIGDTAETILGQVDCSVLAIKPDGFVTPVAP